MGLNIIDIAAIHQQDKRFSCNNGITRTAKITPEKVLYTYIQEV